MVYCYSRYFASSLHISIGLFHILYLLLPLVLLENEIQSLHLLTIELGKKIFYAIPPTPENLAKFEKWVRNPEQGLYFFHFLIHLDSIFFGDLAEPVCKVTILPNQTLLIPSGWIHAVYTPEDRFFFLLRYYHSDFIPMFPISFFLLNYF